MTYIDSLNQRFADSLGRPDGIHARFCWAWSPDIDMGRRSLADQTGPCWLICQWMANQFTPSEWRAIHGGFKPYPGRGRYVPHIETALPIGMCPTAEATAFYAVSLWQQLEAAEQAEKDQYAGRVDAATLQSEAEATAYQQAASSQFYERVADWEPASWALGEPHEPGDQDGPIAYQVGGSRDDACADLTTGVEL